MVTYLVEITTFVKICVQRQKGHLKIHQKITHVDDMMIHNLANMLSKLDSVCEI
jgi:hypothetical protein